MPVAIAKHVRVEDDVFGGKPTCVVSSSYAREQMATLRSIVSAWPCSSKAITTTAAP
jgi:hypothetical protein